MYPLYHSHQYRLSIFFRTHSKIHNVKDTTYLSISFFLGQALALLVLVRLIYYYTYTPSLSPRRLQGGLLTYRYEISYLEVGFTLICFQRLSHRNLATQLCFW